MHNLLSIWAVRAFFLSYLLLGLWIAPDYGVSWDEPIQRAHGIVSTDYINRALGIEAPAFDPEKQLETYEHRYYGVVFSVICFKIERMMGLDTFREQHLMRHYAVFLAFWLGVIGFFKLLQFRFKDWRWALAGVLFILIFPRLFAHSFFNVKDAVLVAAVMWAMYTMVRFLNKPGWRWAVAHGLTSALAIDVRIVAVIIPALTLGWLAVRVVSDPPPAPPSSREGSFLSWIKSILSNSAYARLKKKNDSPECQELPSLREGGAGGGSEKRPGIFGMAYAAAIYLLTMALAMVAFWPYLWANPLKNLLEAYRVMGSYEWGGEVLLWGEFIHPMSGMPWYYLPSWMLITIPVGVGVFFLIGVGLMLGKLRESALLDWVALSVFAAPAAMVILKDSVLYDDWRQLYFIYPAFAFIALAGAEGLHRRFQNKKIIPALVGLTIVVGIAQMVRYHPLQHVFFNELAGTSRVARFDQDYWGVAYKQALERLLEIDSSQLITFYSESYPATANHHFLPPGKHIRLEQVWTEKWSEYYLSNFRERKELNLFRRKAFPFLEPVFFIEAGNTPVIGVYRAGPYWEKVRGKKGAWEYTE